MKRIAAVLIGMGLLAFGSVRYAGAEMENVIENAAFLAGETMMNESAPTNDSPAMEEYEESAEEDV